jgi:flagellar basal-body rod protein FlgB
MIDSIFLHSNVLGKALDAAWLKNNVITNNLANVDTPNFRASSVDFQSVFKDAINGASAASMKKTRDKHMSIGGNDGLSPIVTEDTASVMRMDGNNVDMESEQVELAENAIYYNTVLQKLGEEYSRIKYAIGEGK